MKFSGERLKSLRKSKGITLLQLAEKINVTNSYLSKIERGKSTPSIKRMLQLSDYFNVDPSYFLTDTELENLLKICTHRGESITESEVKMIIEFLDDIRRINNK